MIIMLQCLDLGSLFAAVKNGLLVLEHWGGHILFWSAYTRHEVHISENRFKKYSLLATQGPKCPSLTVYLT